MRKVSLRDFPKRTLARQLHRFRKQEHWDIASTWQCAGAEMPSHNFRVFISFVIPVTPEIRRYKRLVFGQQPLLPSSQRSILLGYLEDKVSTSQLVMQGSPGSSQHHAYPPPHSPVHTAVLASRLPAVLEHISLLAALVHRAFPWVPFFLRHTDKPCIKSKAM